MSYFLDQMARVSQTRVEAARSVATLEVQRRRAEMNPTLALDDGFLVIAEVKPASPAEGRLAGAGPGLIDSARAYASAGASAISVLTEPTEFGGSLDLLEEVSAATRVPVMRKDFIVDPYQVWEGRAHGASGALAITRMLDEHTLVAIVRAAADAEMFVLVEAFDEDDLEVIQSLDLDEERVMVGINSRDLDTLEVREHAHEALAPHLPDGLIAIAESGIASAEQVGPLMDLGYGGVLVGSSLMRSDDPASAVASLVSAGSAR